MQPRREGLLVRDPLNQRLDYLEVEVMRLERLVAQYKSMEKDRVATETAIFVIGILIGIATGFYAQ